MVTNAAVIQHRNSNPTNPTRITPTSAGSDGKSTLNSIFMEDDYEGSSSTPPFNNKPNIAFV
ncbi:hypothetical protein FRC03_009766 [Tulasnella sp. 419]|nr:hypothetical protein FRC03_009766 [Tulasnella sp. 419]